MKRSDSKWYSEGFTQDWFYELDHISRTKFLDSLTDQEAKEYAEDWMVWAHDYQIPPETDWDTWLFLAGRGAGKTRSAVEFIIAEVLAGRATRIAIVGQGQDDVRNVMVEGQSGFLACSPKGFKPQWLPSAGGGKLIWPNGAQAFVYSAVDTEALRGPQFDLGWFDEPMAVPRVQRERALDNLEFCLRLGNHARLILTTTPKKDPWLREFMESAKNPENKIYISKATTHDNARNLAANFLRKIERKYGGSRIGRQEIQGELLGDEEGALWTEESIDKGRMSEESPRLFALRCQRIVVSVDPNTKEQNKTKRTAHAAGIVVVGSIGRDRYVLADCTTKGGPTKWARAAVKAAIDFGADEIHGESNQGGEMVRMVIAQAAEQLGWKGRIHITPAGQSKVKRAEPVATMYDQGLIHHIGDQAPLDKLETQMLYIHEKDDPTGEDFDRVDALVWAIYRLGIKKRATTGSIGRAGIGAIVTFGAFLNGPQQQTGRTVPERYREDAEI